MINLPSLKIIRNDYREAELYLKTKKKQDEDNAKRKEGIHASDLLDPRQAYFKSVDPKELTEREVWLFTIGKVLHTIVLSPVNPDLVGDDSDTGTLENLGILYSMDHTHNTVPVELKTSRSNKEPREDRLQEELQLYLEQLCIYLVMENTLRGELWILYLNLKDESNRTWPEPRCYDVEMTEDQFYQLEQHILETRDALRAAKEQNVFSHLVLCRQWKCGQVCPWWDQCRPQGRYPEKNKKKWKE